MTFLTLSDHSTSSVSRLSSLQLNINIPKYCVQHWNCTSLKLVRNYSVLKKEEEEKKNRDKDQSNKQLNA